MTLTAGFAQIERRLRRLPGVVLDALLPPRCLACGGSVEQQGTLCADCWLGIEFLGPPCCASCGLPFEYDLDPDALCGACMAQAPAYERARSVMRYGDISKRLLLSFKHADRTEGAPAYGAWLARSGAELIALADVIAPVPLHRIRLFKRRYNQSALLAAALARTSGLPLVPDLLLRRRNTPSQGRLSISQRWKNVTGAFAVNPARRADLKGARVLLIDDVMTTGATVEICSRTLRRGGAQAVDVLVLARVVRTQA
jgi:ComF family protein